MSIPIVTRLADSKAPRSWLLHCWYFSSNNLLNLPPDGTAYRVSSALQKSLKLGFITVVIGSPHPTMKFTNASSRLCFSNVSVAHCFGALRNFVIFVGITSCVWLEETWCDVAFSFFVFFSSNSVYASLWKAFKWTLAFVVFLPAMERPHTLPDLSITWHSLFDSQDQP